MKFTMIMDLHESVNKKPLRARSLVFWGNVYEFIDSIKNHHICRALPFVASLVKLYTNSMKNTQNRSKMIATLTFKGP